MGRTIEEQDGTTTITHITREATKRVKSGAGETSCQKRRQHTTDKHGAAIRARLWGRDKGSKETHSVVIKPSNGRFGILGIQLLDQLRLELDAQNGVPVQIHLRLSKIQQPDTRQNTGIRRRVATLHGMRGSRAAIGENKGQWPHNAIRGEQNQGNRSQQRDRNDEPARTEMKLGSAVTVRRCHRPGTI